MSLFSSTKKSHAHTWPTAGAKNNSQIVHPTLYTDPRARQPQVQDIHFPAKSPTWPVQRIRYKPLISARKEIRVLRIHSGTAPSMVCCTMYHTSLSLDDRSISSRNRIPYETISYCWGTNPGQDVIQLDGETVMVTGSAERVLRRMRLPREDRVVWIDAICIDQGSDEEKSGQVALMGEVYRNTWHNLVWLGDDMGYAHSVVKALHAVLKNIRVTTSEYTIFYKMTHDSAGVFSRNGNALRGSIDTASLVALFSCQWFGRLWVAQEVALPPQTTCHFGDAEFPLVDVLRVAVWLLYNSKQVPDIVDNPGLWRATNLWNLADHQCMPRSILARNSDSLSAVYQLLRHMECSQPKDNVYALLAIWNPRKPELKDQLMPKYNDSTENVFRNTTRVIIEESRSLLVLQEKSSDESTNMPSGSSWAVQFDLKNGRHNGPRRLNCWNFDANDGQFLHQSTMNPRREADVLFLRGIAVATVARRGSHMPSLFEINAWPYIQEIRQMVNLARSGKARVNDVHAALAKTLMGGGNWLGDTMWSDDLHDFAALMKYLDAARASPSYDWHLKKGQIDDRTRRASRCFDALAQTCSKRRFFMTNRGDLGIGPGDIADGDLIVVLYGGPVPFILRQIEGRYRYIGACYAEGMMQGETMRQHKAEKKKDAVFEIE